MQAALFKTLTMKKKNEQAIIKAAIEIIIKYLNK
jgi:hypothetical protein